METQSSYKLNFEQPFALIKKRNEEDVLFLEGKIIEVDQLDDIPRKRGKDPLGERFDTISMIPFSQIRERNFKTHHDGEKIICLKVKKQTWIPQETLSELLPRESVKLESDIQYDYSYEDYENVTRAIIHDEIGNGEGANFVISRQGSAKIVDMGLNKVLSLYRNLLRNEMGSYWEFLFFDGKQYFVGATPERHISVYKGEVKMNPISGTFRKKLHYHRRADFKKEFVDFLSNPKEINELFMVVDEELKMMARFCEQGGIIVGPLLKEMSKLIHTEYLLDGKSSHDIIELLRNSMYAATVTGSPVENACNIICKYEKESRSYYASTIALIGRDDEGSDTLDSPITIRTVEIDEDGTLLLRVGATLVRDSIPSEEVEETIAKIGGMRQNIENPPETPPQAILPYFAGDDEIQILLQQRNQYLSKFWFFNQEEAAEHTFDNYRVTIIDNEDDFCLMMQHMIHVMGATTKVVRYSDYNLSEDNADLVIVGPGPGNPNELDSPKMKKNYDTIQELLQTQRKFLAVCLGHQILCKALNINVVKKENPFQGVQEKIDFFGVQQRVGFYNTFAGQFEKPIPGIGIAYDTKNNEIHALKGSYFESFQFHAESILTHNGYDILKKALSAFRPS